MTDSDIKKLYQAYHVPSHVIAHMKKVAEIAIKIGRNFVRKGYKIDLENLKKAALLHDLVRVCDFRDFDHEELAKKHTAADIKIWQELRSKYSKIGHVKAAYRILNAFGEKKIAKLVLAHDFFYLEKLKTWEEKILYYADKRVNGDKIVSLKKRFSEGAKRNALQTDSKAHITAIKKKIFVLEKEILKTIGKSKIS